MTSGTFGNLPLVYDKTISARSTSNLLSHTPYGIVICDKGEEVHVQITFVLVSKLAGAPDLYRLKTLNCGDIKGCSCPNLTTSNLQTSPLLV